MSRLVDDRTLELWRELDALVVLDRLGCYAKRDMSFRPIKASKTARYHVNANGRDWELLLTGPKFWDSRAEKGGGGAIDLAMHLFALDFKRALLMLRSALTAAPSEPANGPAVDRTPQDTPSTLAGTQDGPA
ncbi:hypothetical protein [Paraburkholderia bengalensis]|uniref:hypothetical protein n=1 Tax=Paraburkholderia bengalensis TaxID=2747562 RepID=UPI003015397C